MLRRLTLLISLLLGGALVLGGCGSSLLDDLGKRPSSAPSAAPVQVSGAVGEPPALDYEQPYDVVQAGARTVWPGSGEPVVDGEPVLLNMYAEDGRDGTVISSTYIDAPGWYSMSPESLGSNLYDTLRGQKVGARMLLLEQDGDVPVILVVDVLPTHASGAEVSAAKGLPTVERGDGGAPSVTVPRKADAPADLQVQPLVRGTGPQVQVGQVVTMRFTAVRWSDGRQFDTTWTAGTRPQSATIGIGQLVDGLDQGLVEQTVGSQVLLVVPPSLGYGGTSSDLADETLVYVVDILDAHFQVTEDESTGKAKGDDGGDPEQKSGKGSDEPAGSDDSSKEG
ncbi:MULTISPECIES: FKBP-type peptidyl-prolyl cis-trans isomerase [unclassified Isoptericola]|uniref:FKBP-type peptidyl-prolyl cis-trans isomerase n=1 Tax=unclassified Isoptericola TaxID=2623355 RepID=UPI0035E5E7ED|nr:FKBP-type peptidyl-prolyl cis-trans isomerase [Isoptericola sp. QY 916]